MSAPLIRVESAAPEQFTTWPFDFPVIQAGLRQRGMGYPDYANHPPQVRRQIAQSFLDTHKGAVRNDPFIYALAAIHIAKIGSVAERGEGWFEATRSEAEIDKRNKLPSIRVFQSDSERDLILTMLALEWARTYAKTSHGFLNPQMNPTNISGACFYDSNGTPIARAVNNTPEMYDQETPKTLVLPMMDQHGGLNSMVFWQAMEANKRRDKDEAGLIFTFCVNIAMFDPRNFPLQDTVPAVSMRS